MTSNDQYPGNNQPLEPTDVPPTDPATPDQAPAFLDDPTIIRDRGVGSTASGAAQQPSAPSQSPAPTSPNFPAAGTPNAPAPGTPSFPAPGTPNFPAPPAAGWGAAPPSQPYPTPDQPYPVAPYAGVAGASPQPGAPFGPPGGYPAPGQPPAGTTYPFPTGGQPPTSGKKGGKIALFVGLGILALVLGLIAFFVIRAIAGSDTSGRPTTAKAAVQGYLQALAAGDASAAIDLGETAPSDLSLLTDEVLKASLALAPITNIQVKDGSGSTSAVVSASYQLGTTLVTGTFQTTKIGSEWRLKETAKEVHVFSGDSADLTLNGIVFSRTDTLTLFPGSYVLASPTDRIKVDGGEFVIKSPMDYASPSLTFSLSDKGQTDARTAAQTLLDSCVKKNDLNPDGCGFGFTPGSVKVKTVKWRISSGPNEIQKADFTLDSSDQSAAKAYVYIALEVTVKDTAGRTYVDQDSIGTIKADLSGAEVSIAFS